MVGGSRLFWGSVIQVVRIGMKLPSRIRRARCSRLVSPAQVIQGETLSLGWDHWDGPLRSGLLERAKLNIGVQEAPCGSVWRCRGSFVRHLAPLTFHGTGPTPMADGEQAPTENSSRDFAPAISAHF